MIPIFEAKNVLPFIRSSRSMADDFEISVATVDGW
jgi:hypothetical protein